MSKMRNLLSFSFYRERANRLVRRSKWYRNVFEDYFRISRIQQHQDILNLGSNPAKFALDYQGSGIRGFNLAVSPQTVSYDLNMLKNYHSYLGNDGPRVLLLVFCPFSLCKDYYVERDGDTYKDLRYYPILHHAMIHKYDEATYQLWVRHPGRLLLKNWKRILLAKKNKLYKFTTNPLDETGMQKSADNFISSWKNEFHLSDFEIDHLSEEVKRSLCHNSEVLDKIISFCKERDINPVFVLPPLSQYINVQIPADFKEHCMYSILRGKDIPLLDYAEDERFIKPEYFVNALYLNKTGRLAFTKQVIDDLKQHKIL